MLWERCCTDLKEALEAAGGRAKRIELCQCLEVGGITPPMESVTACIAALHKDGCKVNVLVRPRGGDFVYSEDEVQEMLSSIRQCREAGADGIVIGALLANGDIDAITMSRLMAEAGGMSVTFHRAFDECRDPHAALEEIINLGCDRLLTSGQAPSAAEGSLLITELVRQARGRIIIMPGAGVTPANAGLLARETGAHELHGSKLF